MTGNSAALRRARRRDGLAKRRQALAAIETMAEAGDPISFPSVARHALLTEQDQVFQQFNG